MSCSISIYRQMWIDDSVRRNGLGGLVECGIMWLGRNGAARKKIFHKDVRHFEIDAARSKAPWTVDPADCAALAIWLPALRIDENM